MKIYVCVKQVPDTEAKINVKSDGSGIETTNVKWVMNPYDEYGVEEALKIKQAKGDPCIVTAIAVGPKGRVVDTLRTALAMGADDAIVIDAPETLDSFSTAQAIAKSIQAEGSFDLIFTGKLAIDDNGSAVSQQIAHFLGIPHVTVVSKMTLKDGSVEVERDTEGGTKEVVEMNLPGLVAANKGLNMPRYASLPGIMKAKKKAVKELSYDSLGIEPPRIQFKSFQPPPENPAIKMISGDVSTQCVELVRLLREEVKVI